MTRTSATAHLPSFADLGKAAPSHFVHFYEDDDALARSVAEFIGVGLERGGAGVVVATGAHKDGVDRHLAERGLDLAGLGAQGRYLTLDASRVLPQVMVDGKPHADRFEEILTPLLLRAAAGGHGVRVFGELVALLCRDGNADGAVRLEGMWNDLGRRHPFSLFCAYPIHAFGRESDAKAFGDVCATHELTLPGESWLRLDEPDHRMDYVARLQQKAAAHDQEVARRKELEDALRGRDLEIAQFLERTQDGVLDVDMDGTIRWANAAFLGAVALGPEDCIGRPVKDFLAQSSVFSDVWARLAKGQAVRDVLTDLRCGDGATRPVRILSSTLRMAGRALQMRWFTRLSA